MALKVLGPDFYFDTYLSYKGEIKNGILDGNIYLKGTGDPLLTMSDIFNIVMILKQSGIKKITGRFFYDESFLSNTIIIDENGEKDQSYNPGLSALSSEFNLFFAWREGHGESTSKSNFIPIPPLPSVVIDKSKNKFTHGLKFEYSPEDNLERWKVSNKLKYGRKEKIPVRNPALHTAETFFMFAKQSGINIPLPQKGVMPDDVHILYTQKSPPLIKIAKETLEYSNNVLAELLMLRAVRKLENKPLSIEESAFIIKKWYSTQIPRSDWKDIYFHNGSGITSKNRMSPKIISEILDYANSLSFGNRYFWSILSTSGWNGWIKDRLRAPSTALKVWAKTGSLDYASGLAGYIITNKGQRLAFGIFITDFKKRNLMDGKNQKLTNRLRSKAINWLQKAQNTQDKLIRLWINELEASENDNT